MAFQRWIYAMAVFFLLPLPGGAAPDTLRVLWLGNSLIQSTYSRTEEVARCGTQLGVPVYNRYGTYMYDATYGWNNTPDNKTLVSTGNWDYVALQVIGSAGAYNVSWDGFSLDSAKNAIRNWDTLIKASGAKTVFYHPWGTDGFRPQWNAATQTWKPDRMDTMVTHITGLCQELGAMLFPVGPAQWEVQKRDPSIVLWVDWIHGSAEACYLGGLTCFAALTGLDVRSVTNFYNLDSQDAAFLRDIAWETVNRPQFLPYEHSMSTISESFSGSPTEKIALLQAFPNPFKNSVSLSAAVPFLEIYDLRGKRVALLKSGRGNDFEWNAGSCAPGLYIVRGMSGSRTLTLPLVRVR